MLPKTQVDFREKEKALRLDAFIERKFMYKSSRATPKNTTPHP
jgi:hypothetical protein